MPDPHAKTCSGDAEAAFAVASQRDESVTPVLVLRSLAFNIAFYVNIVAWMLMCLPAMALPRRAMLGMVQAWARSTLTLMRVLTGTRMQVRGRDRLPAGGFILASKHQSVWETFALLTVVDDPAFILKRELTWIPLFGWLAWKAGMIPIDRQGGSGALAGMNRRAAEAVAAGRQLIIFPEGTRRAAGAPPSYKAGVSHLYRALGVPCLPAALNSGWFWPRRRFLRRPGTVVVELLEPLPPGLPREVFMTRLQAGIESASDGLLAEARQHS